MKEHDDVRQGREKADEMGVNHRFQREQLGLNPTRDSEEPCRMKDGIAP